MTRKEMQNLNRRLARRLNKEVGSGRRDEYVGQLINLRWLYRKGLRGSALQESWAVRAEEALHE
jgi:hypothetical protein